MKERQMKAVRGSAGLLVVALVSAVPVPAKAHCDTLGGPVVAAAKAALEKGDVTPLLRWVKKDDEKAIRVAFEKTLAVRSKGPEAKELADMYFFETLVRIHRAGEGAPYTGLKAADAEVDPAVRAADHALEKGSADELVKTIAADMEKGIRERFAAAAEAKKHADESVDVGREFVEAYVEFTHYVERLHQDATGKAAHTAEPEAGGQHLH
jgi:hypothetical protein